MTCIPLRDLCSYLFPHLFSHGSRARAATSVVTSLQSPEEERKGESNKESTSREETTTSSSPHLGLQCSYNSGALQNHNYYEWCASCDLEDDVKEEEDILATCLHLYDVDIKDGKCYMLNLPQPRLQSSMVLHLHSQSGLVNFEHTSTSVSLSTSTSWTSPTMQRTLLQPTSWCSRHQQDVDNM